ncbi:MAG: hypothetical protein CVV27_09690 [Candidatus Melainabacteria bacterium HGW-Melainabacteria-1]|nr:MAG: hypothetical protein CVV27_09690 [Candidatus Melainabacteria bacterium HGW-Melainabacteria-1]
MRYLLFGILSLSLLIACGPAPQVPAGSPSPASPQPGVSGQPSPNLSPEPSASPSPSTQPGSPSPGASVFPPSNLPAGLSSIKIDAPNRFLYAVGESLQLKLVLLDAAGQPLSFSGTLPLEWSSSRAGDFSVDAQGKATALVADGYSMIGVKISGTSFQASLTLNVTDVASGGGGEGGGGGSTSAPTSATGTFIGGFE